MLASLDGMLGDVLAGLALQPQDNLLCGLSLLVKDGLGLSSVTRLLPVITPLTLRIERILALLVLGNLVKGVLLAVLSLAEGLLGLRNVHHCGRTCAALSRTGLVAPQVTPLS